MRTRSAWSSQSLTFSVSQNFTFAISAACPLLGASISMERWQMPVFAKNIFHKPGDISCHASLLTGIPAAIRPPPYAGLLRPKPFILTQIKSENYMT